jgi:hypothetical protein
VIIRGKLGSPWTFAAPGISIKPFPSGALTYPAMSKMQELVTAVATAMCAWPDITSTNAGAPPLYNAMTASMPAWLRNIAETKCMNPPADAMVM